LRFDCDYELVENTNVCFETYKYFFELLKEMDNLPFQRYLLDPKLKEIPAPNYLLFNPLFHFSSLLNLEIISQHQIPIREIAPVLCLDSWPGPDELDLDWSQYHALRLALAKELAVIQGPPGTGKTYVGLKIVQLLLENNGGLGEQIRSDDDDVDDHDDDYYDNDDDVTKMMIKIVTLMMMKITMMVMTTTMSIEYDSNDHNDEDSNDGDYDDGDNADDYSDDD